MHSNTGGVLYEETTRFGLDRLSDGCTFADWQFPGKKSIRSGILRYHEAFGMVFFGDPSVPLLVFEKERCAIVSFYTPITLSQQEPQTQSVALLHLSILIMVFQIPENYDVNASFRSSDARFSAS